MVLSGVVHVAVGSPWPPRGVGRRLKVTVVHGVTPCGHPRPGLAAVVHAVHLDRGWGPLTQAGSHVAT